VVRIGKEIVASDKAGEADMVQANGQGGLPERPKPNRLGAL